MDFNGLLRQSVSDSPAGQWLGAQQREFEEHALGLIGIEEPNSEAGAPVAGVDQSIEDVLG